MGTEENKSLREPIPVEAEKAAKGVVEAAFAVHSALGPGLLESVYEVCLAHELAKRGLHVERQVGLPVIYDNIKLDAGLRLDLLVNNCLIVEIKAVQELLPVHKGSAPDLFETYRTPIRPADKFQCSDYQGRHQESGVIIRSPQNEKDLLCLCVFVVKKTGEGSGEVTNGVA